MKKKIVLILCALLFVNPMKASAKEDVDKKIMYVSANSGLNIRKEASVESDKISALRFNTEVEIKSIKDGWAKISHEKQDAYICAEYLSEEKLEETGGNITYLGTFTASHYCPCSACCGWSTGITASGTYATPGRTVGVDTSIIPLGTRLIIDGKEYVAEDTGSGVNGNWVDIFVNDHQEALNLGLKTVEVYISE